MNQLFPKLSITPLPPEYTKSKNNPNDEQIKNQQAKDQQQMKGQQYSKDFHKLEPFEEIKMPLLYEKPQVKKISYKQATGNPSKPAYSNPKRAQKSQRKMGGTSWVDPSLQQWPQNDFRIFVGDLGNQVSDQALKTAFSKYKSFVKAKVVRDSSSGKSKGYGFISILEVNDYMRAMKQMQGRYIGNRPVKLKRSKWEERSAKGGKSEIKNTKFKKNNVQVKKMKQKD